MARAKSRGTTKAAKSAKRDSVAPAKRDSVAPAKRDSVAPAKRDSVAPAKAQRSRKKAAKAAAKPNKRASTLPPQSHVPRSQRQPWPETEWSPENHDVASAQDVLLMAYWIADQLADPALADHRRTGLRAAVRSVAPILRNAGEGSMSPFIVSATVRRNSAIMLEAQRSERERLPEGNLLAALLETHEDEAVHATVAQIRLHSSETASWLEELERRGRPELRNALRLPGNADKPSEALRRLLAIVLFATEQLSRRSKPAAQ
jgi:hypothetical protein